MPSQPGTANDKQYNLQWVHIDDFSPGCYDAGHISTETPVSTQPLGAAYLPNTFCCASVPGGALAPLPMLTSTLPFSTIGGLPGSATSALIAGFIIVPQLNNNHYEVVTVVQADDGVNRYLKTTSWESVAASLHTISGPTITSTTQAGYFGAPYPAFTRMNTTGTGNVPPKLVFPTSDDSGHTTGHLWVYPSISAPTTFVADDIAGSTFVGQVITYGNRVICIVGQNYSWPAGTGVNTNENFNYTDPPESNVYGSQNTIMAVEAPWGYGAWGTMSVGELMLIKKDSGGVILNGDINVPTSIIRIPGVEPVGDFVGHACATPLGLVYCSQNRGAWIWNGGSTSQKISKNINDSFFDLETNLLASNNYGFFVDFWQKWLVFSNNIIYDTETNSWWKLFPNSGTNATNLPNGRNIWWYCLTNNGNQMGCAPLQVGSNSDPWLSIFDNTVPSQSYQWESLPIHTTPNADRVIDVRQVIIRASDPTNSGSATVALTVNGTSVATSTQTIGVDPTSIRFNVGVEGVYDVIVRVFATNTSSNAAPTIHSIDVGWTERAGVGVND